MLAPYLSSGTTVTAFGAARDPCWQTQEAEATPLGSGEGKYLVVQKDCVSVTEHNKPNRA